MSPIDGSRDELTTPKVIDMRMAPDAPSVTVLAPSFVTIPDPEWDAAMDLLAELLTPIVRRRVQKRLAA